MKLRLLRTAALAGIVSVMLPACQKEDLKPTAPETGIDASVNKDLAVNFEPSGILKKNTTTLKNKFAAVPKIDEIHAYLLQKINKARTTKAVTPSECGPTPFDAQINKYVNQFGPLEFDMYSTYAAINQLWSIIDESKQYFGPKGQYTGLVKKYQTKLEAFWKMPNEVRVNGEHNNTLDNRYRIAQVYILFAGAPEDVAYQIADEILFINKISPVFTETPLLSFDAFATTDDLIVLGDGIVQVLAETGIQPEIVLAGILSHEWGHQVQFNNSLSWYGIPTGFWPATAEFTRFTELEADFFSSYFMSAKNGGTYNWKKLSQFFNLFYNIGDCSFTSPSHHGTPNQRLASARLAYLIAQAVKYTGFNLNATQIHQLYVAVNGFIIGETLNYQAALTTLKDSQQRAIFGKLLMHKMEIRNIITGKLSKSAIENL